MNSLRNNNSSWEKTHLASTTFHRAIDVRVEGLKRYMRYLQPITQFILTKQSNKVVVLLKQERNININKESRMLTYIRQTFGVVINSHNIQQIEN